MIVALERGGTYAWVKIQDTGIGICPIFSIVFGELTKPVVNMRMGLGWGWRSRKVLPNVIRGILQ